MKLEENHSLQRYLNDIKHYPLLTADQEKECSDIIQNSDDEKAKQKAMDRLVLGNLRLVVKFALGYHKKVCAMEDVNLSLMDIIEEGNIGLMHAAELFNPSKFKGVDGGDIRFSTYAYLSIQRRCKIAVKKSHFVRLPVNYFKLFHRMESLEEEYRDKLTDEILLRELNITASTLEGLKKNKSSKVSVEDFNYLLERSGFDSGKRADLSLSNKELREYLLKKIKELTPRHRDVLYTKFFTNDSEITLQKIGDKRGVSKENIRQILLRALKILRKKIKEDQLMLKIMKRPYDPHKNLPKHNRRSPNKRSINESER